MNPLIGKIVKEVWLHDDREAIKFVLNTEEEVVAICDADCCSQTWIEDVLGIDALIGATILRVEDIDLPSDLCGPTKTNFYVDEMEYYGLAIETDRGRFTIAYRNSSNGYYGGSLEWPGSSFHASQTSAKHNHWKLITEDN